MEKHRKQQLKDKEKALEKQPVRFTVNPRYYSTKGKLVVHLESVIDAVDGKFLHVFSIVLRMVAKQASPLDSHILSAHVERRLQLVNNNQNDPRV
jgi:hypothetical protein